MDLHALIAFAEVARYQSFSLAADALFISQPAISKRISALEAELGTTLFNRINRKVTLTEAGRALLPRVQALRTELEDIRRLASNLSGNVQGALTMGTSHHIGLHHLPNHLRNYVQTFPEVTLDVHFVDSEQAHEKVLAGDLELAFLTLPPQGDARLSYVTIWDDPLVFVAASFHPLANQKNLQLEDLIQYPSLLPAAQTYTSQITLAEFEKRGLKPKVSMSNNPLESIRMLASIGLGWSVLPKTLINQDLQQLDINFEMNRQLGMVWHPGRSQSKAVLELIEMMKIKG